MSENAVATLESPRLAPLRAAAFHHLGIQTADLANCVSWYQEFFGCKENWNLDEFSELTTSRLPGIVKLVELRAGGTRFHLFERAGEGSEPPEPGNAQFQHVCMEVGSPAEMSAWQRHWTRLYESGRFHFTRDEPATEIVTDDDGVQSFYAFDVNGLEYEFTWIPEAAS
ncbi:VOC family protein [Amycolatopsis sp. NBC_01307]|uniref:VOC family protein n=1 Tax=Amycolatopsis sp. NBC_01307 TaxID=2903561 RepID=UPI002E109FA1|nr:VOC family protein [Amycolatopsis sp. NBC_01307]